jgi:hypothetical protein
MTEELLAIIQRCPAKLKQRMATIRGSNCLPPEVAEKLGIQFDPSMNGGTAGYADFASSTLHRTDVIDSSNVQSNSNVTPPQNGELGSLPGDSMPTPTQRRVIGVDQYRKRYLDSRTDVVVKNDDKKGPANGPLSHSVAMKKPRSGSLLSEVLKHDPVARPTPPPPPPPPQPSRERTTSGSDRHDKPHAHAPHHTGDQRGYNKHDVYRSSSQVTHSSARERVGSVSNSDHSASHNERERERDRERDRDRDRDRARERHVSSTAAHAASTNSKTTHDSKGDVKPHDLPTTVPKPPVRRTEEEIEEGEISDDD